MQEYGLLINGQWTAPNGTTEVRSPFTGEPIFRVSLAGETETRAAVDAAAGAFTTWSHTPAHERSRLLHRATALIEERKEDLARTLAQEAGKPIRDARGEVGRAIQTFRFAAEEAKRLYGETIPMDAAIGSEGRMGITFRQPIGVIAAISPFNFPLNLVAHKVAPALASANTVVLKPATQTPVSALKLGEILTEAGFPPGVFNVVVGSGGTVGEALVASEKVAMVTFTGSPPVGMGIRNRAGMKKVILELGSNSATIVHEDADLALAARQLARGAFAYAGQICISVQRILVHESVRQRFLSLFLPLVQALKVGDPLSEETDVGPMIDRGAADRGTAWVHEALDGGARALVTGKQEGNLVWPWVLTDVNREMKIVCEEAFAPVVTVQTYQTFEEAIALVNDSQFGLQAGVFTNNLNLAFQAGRQIRTGGVIVNDTSNYRADHMPYGGLKLSGMGR
ncbi:MAG TPA: aldehyde dehydrogenase family protein, partial [Chloroflexota bacterium]|nr:aldehyde dehydrogenase family protein [Chloroflexota bacterium]